MGCEQRVSQGEGLTYKNKRYRQVHSTKRCAEPFSSSGGWDAGEGEAKETTEELTGTSSWLTLIGLRMVIVLCILVGKDMVGELSIGRL